jgi:hypothetical protein
MLCKIFYNRGGVIPHLLQYLGSVGGLIAGPGPWRAWGPCKEGVGYEESSSSLGLALHHDDMMTFCLQALVVVTAAAAGWRPGPGVGQARGSDDKCDLNCFEVAFGSLRGPEVHKDDHVAATNWGRRKTYW